MEEPKLQVLLCLTFAFPQLLYIISRISCSSIARICHCCVPSAVPVAVGLKMHNEWC